MQDELKTIKLSKKDKKNIPLGFNTIFIKTVMDDKVKERLAIRSLKYNKITFEAYRTLQPISKLFDD